MNLLKYSVNPYNINRTTLALGEGVLGDEAYTKNNCARIIKTRERLKKELEKMGFTVLDSKANFLFAAHKTVSGEAVYKKLKAKNILVRYFDKDRLRPFVRITVGTDEQTDRLLSEIKIITEEL